MKILITEGNIILTYNSTFNTGKSSNIIVDIDEMTLNQLTVICEANGLKCGKKRKAEIISLLIDYVSQNIQEEPKMSNTEQLVEIVKQGFDQELPDDDIQENMYNAGCPFKEVMAEFKRITTELGLRLSPKERAAKTNVFLEGYNPDSDDVEGHLAKLSALQDHLNCSSTAAGASMRKWAKENEIEMPKAPKKPKVSPGFRGNPKIIADHALQNKDITFDELVAFASENVEKTKGGKDSSRGYAVTVWNAIIFAKSWESVDYVEDEVEDEKMVA